MSDKADPPIVPQDYLGGVKVVDIGDIRVARGMSRRPVSVCKHRSLVYDTHERRIWCSECETNLDGFDAFALMTSQYHKAYSDLMLRMEKVEQAEAHALVSRSAKVMDKAWRSRRLAPCCPHCHGALLPEDFANGVGLSVSSELERQRRKPRP